MVGLEGTFVEGIGPVGFIDFQSRRTSSIFHVGIEFYAPLNRIVVMLDFVQKSLFVDPFHFVGEIREGLSGHFGDTADPVFITQQVGHFLIKNLPGELVRLLQNHPSIFGISVIAEICAFVHEAPAGGIDHDSKWVGMFLESVSHGEIPEFRSIVIPADGMAAGPVSVRGGSDLEGHADPVSGVEASSPDLGHFPTRAQISGAPFGV